MCCLHPRAGTEALVRLQASLLQCCCNIVQAASTCGIDAMCMTPLIKAGVVCLRQVCAKSSNILIRQPQMSCRLPHYNHESACHRVVCFTSTPCGFSAHKLHQACQLDGSTKQPHKVLLIFCRIGIPGSWTPGSWTTTVDQFIRSWQQC